jgi:hypothetical protein
MAFNPNRVVPGTIELVRDSDGNYTSRVVGLESINSLSLPEISTTAAVTKTDTDAKTATDITGDTIQNQTQMAFKTSDSGDRGPDTTGDMLQEAKKTSGMLSDTFADARSLMTSDQAYRGVDNRFDADTFDDEVGSRIEEPTKIESPTERVFRSDTQRFKDEFDPTKVDSRLDVGKELKGSAAVQAGKAEPPGFDFSFLGGRKFNQGTASTNPVGGVDQMAADAIDRQEIISGATADDATANTLGITADPTQSATRAAKEADFASGILGNRTVADSDIEADAGTKARVDIKPEAKKTFAQSVNTALKGIGEVAQMLSPVGAVVKELGRPVGESAGAVAFNKTYFTDRGDGRIGGNPATDLYAGFNRVSKFGNLEKAGDKRLATRQKTIEKKGYGPGDKFYDDTQKMKDQANDYKQKKKEAPVTGTTKPGESGGSEATGGGKIVCTMMNQSYGFGSFRNKIWMKFHGNIAPEYQKGYHKLFLPLVNYAKQKGITNKIIKNILEHIAVHSTIDMRQTLRGKRHTLGRLYRKIILPLCYWAGKK